MQICCAVCGESIHPSCHFPLLICVLHSPGIQLHQREECLYRDWLMYLFYPALIYKLCLYLEKFEQRQKPSVWQILMEFDLGSWMENSDWNCKSACGPVGAAVGNVVSPGIMQPNWDFIFYLLQVSMFYLLQASKTCLTQHLCMS